MPCFSELSSPPQTLSFSFPVSAGVPEEAGPQAGSGQLPSETCPTSHQVPAAPQGVVPLSQLMWSPTNTVHHCLLVSVFI